MTLLSDTMMLAEAHRALVADVRATPAAPGHGARLDAAISDIAALRCRAESAAIERLARARARRACLKPTSSPWERRKADQADDAAANITCLATDVLAAEAELRGLVDVLAFYQGVIR